MKELNDIEKEVQEILDEQVKQIDINKYIAIRSVYKSPLRTPELQTIKTCF